MNEMNPYYAYRHFEEASWLGPTDREAAETLWKAYRRADKRAKGMEHTLQQKLLELEAAMAAMEKDDE